MKDRILGNRYELGSEIGRGGMGVVYRATDTQVKRAVAVKTLPAVMSHNQDLMRRFTSEVQHASKLEHPNIVRVYDVGEDDGTHFYVMQYIDGPDLRSRMKSKGRYSVDETISIISQVADALGYAHSQGIVHRDIKPENILLDSDGVAHVADFGIAKATEGTRTTRGMLGTPEYMSPEQVKGKSVDGRSDQYSLAVVAYEMLTGRTPFKTEGDDPWAQINMHLNTAVPNPRTTVPDIPTHVANALLQALAKKPEQRFSSCEEFVMSLRGEIEAVVPNERGRAKKQVAWKIPLVVGLSCAVAWVVWPSCGNIRAPQRQHSTHSPQAKAVNQVAFISTIDGVSRVVAVTPGSDDRVSISLPFRLGDEILQNATISPDGRTVLYTTDKAIYVLREGRRARLAKSAYAVKGAITDDSRWATYCDPDIHVIRLSDLKDLRVISSDKASPPAFSIDGKIAYADTHHICVVNRDGSGHRQMTTREGDYSNPVFSPDGEALVFVADKSLYLLTRTGQLRLLLAYSPHTKQELVNTPDMRSYYRDIPCDSDCIERPSFSSDGRKIAVVQRCEGDVVADTMLTIIDLASGSNTTRKYRYRDEYLIDITNPSFSTDGRSLVFEENVLGGDSRVFVADTLSGKVSFVGYGREPCWIRRDASKIKAAAKPARLLVPAEVKGKATQISADLNGDGTPESAGAGVIKEEYGLKTSLVWISNTTRVLWRKELTCSVNQIIVKDVTGDGVPELICVMDTDGGSGCYWEFYVYQMAGEDVSEILKDGGTPRGGYDWLLDTSATPAVLVNLSPLGNFWENPDSPSRYKAEFMAWHNGKFVTARQLVTSRNYFNYADMDKALRELGAGSYLRLCPADCRN